MNRKTCAFRNGVADGEDVGEIEKRRDALRVEVESESDDIDVSGSFTVPKYRALDSISTSKDTQFRSRNSAACITEIVSNTLESAFTILTSVIMSMQGDNDLLSLGNVRVKVFDLIDNAVSKSLLSGRRLSYLISKTVRSRDFDRCRKVLAISSQRGRHRQNVVSTYKDDALLLATVTERASRPGKPCLLDRFADLDGVRRLRL